jgi:hypothetical protein
MREIYDRLQSYALANYEEDGWDFFVECCGFDDFCERAAEVGFTTYEEALKYYKETYRILSDRRADIKAEAF